MENETNAMTTDLRARAVAARHELDAAAQELTEKLQSLGHLVGRGVTVDIEELAMRVHDGANSMDWMLHNALRDVDALLGAAVERADKLAGQKVQLEGAARDAIVELQRRYGRRPLPVEVAELADRAGVRL